jgi:hypothetical protein
MTSSHAVWNAIVREMESTDNLMDGIHKGDEMFFLLRGVARQEGEHILGGLYKTMHAIYQCIIHKNQQDAGEDLTKFKYNIF